MKSSQQIVGQLCRLNARRNTERGVTSIEYALLGVLIALAIIGGLSGTGENNEGIWSDWIARVLAVISP